MSWSTLEGTDGKVQVYRYINGVDSPGGTFTLTFSGGTSSPIPWNASAASLEAALEVLPQVGDITVFNSPADATVDFSSTVATWLIEFTTVGTPPNLGDLPLLEADGSFLTGTAVGVVVEEISTGCCAVEVSANGGADFSNVSDLTVANCIAFRYQDRPVVRAVKPSTGPASGGTLVTVLGAGFDLSSTATPGIENDFVCVFGDRLESPATRLNSTAAQCKTPYSPRWKPGVMSVALRWKGSVTLSITTAVFTYFEDTTLEALVPRRGSNSGGFSTVISIGRGSFVAMGVDVTCVIDVRIPSNLTSEYNIRQYITPARLLSSALVLNLTAEVIRPILSKEIYACEMPGLDDFFPGVGVDKWLDTNFDAMAFLSLSGNGGTDLTTPLTFTYDPKPAVLAVEPALGVCGGGTSVIVHGTRLAPLQGGYNNYELLCRFGHETPIPARYISESAVECASPSHSNVPAIMLVLVEGASVFHCTQEVLLRIPSPMQSEENILSYSHYTMTGTWTLSLEAFETYPMNVNITAAEITFALLDLPNVRNTTVTVAHKLLSDPYAGLFWNETSYTVSFISRGGNIPMLSVNTSNLCLASSGDSTFDKVAGDSLFLPVLSPESSVRIVEEGHDGDSVIREVQVLKTKRSEPSTEVQTVTVGTVLSPTAEVSFRL